MPRTKQSLPAEPKDPKSVKHGCASCTHKEDPVSNFPCKDCGAPKGLWLYWEDAGSKGRF
jgi:hypothetical protein